MHPQMLKVKGPTPDLEGAFSAMMKEGAEALVILEVPVTIEHQKRIAELAAMHRLPTMFPGGQANAGGLITYGTSILDAVPRMPGYVDKIIKGRQSGRIACRDHHAERAGLQSQDGQRNWCDDPTRSPEAGGPSGSVSASCPHRKRPRERQFLCTFQTWAHRCPYFGFLEENGLDRLSRRDEQLSGKADVGRARDYLAPSPTTTKGAHTPGWRCHRRRSQWRRLLPSARPCCTIAAP